MIGIRETFRGCIAKVWSGVNFSRKHYHGLNKILVRHCVLCYNKCWKHRNEVFHDETKQRHRAENWYKNLKEHVENKEPPQACIFVRRNELDLVRCKTETTFQWIYNVKEMIRNVEKMPKNDIRRYFEI